MNNPICEELSERIEVVPQAVLDSNCNSKAALRNAKIAHALNNMETGKGIIYGSEEFFKEFGKTGKTSLISALQKTRRKEAWHSRNERQSLHFLQG